MLKIKLQFINEKDRLKIVKIIEENYIIAEESDVIEPKGKSQFYIQHLTVVDK